MHTSPRNVPELWEPCSAPFREIGCILCSRKHIKTLYHVVEVIDDISSVEYGVHLTCPICFSEIFAEWASFCDHFETCFNWSAWADVACFWYSDLAFGNRPIVKLVVADRDFLVGSMANDGGIVRGARNV